MKLLIVCVALFVVCAAERCGNDNDCKLTTCSDGAYHVRCVHNECTCVRDGGNTCKVQADCRCDRGNPHCIDGKCHCTRF